MEDDDKILIRTKIAHFYKICGKTLHILLATVILLVLLISLHKEFVPQPDTYGEIWIDSPEVYTRERLVNDRFSQDSWLTTALKKKYFTANRSSYDNKSHVKMAREQPSTNDPNRSLQDNGASGSVGTYTESKFIDELDYRSIVRNLKIENQLDDRHDLNGNTLYRLKFDATIVPGVSTRALANIEVTMKLPECKSSENDNIPECFSPTLERYGHYKKIARLRAVYQAWLLNLQARLNQTHREQKQAYYNNEFKKQDYNRLKNYFRIYHNLDVESYDKCKLCMSEGIKEKDSSEVVPFSVNHFNEKACIRAILRCKMQREESLNKSNKKNKALIYGASQNSGEYKDSDLSQSIPELKVSKELDGNLNTFLAGKTLQLVLGIDVPLVEFFKTELYQIPQLKLLSKISFFRSELKTTNYKVFLVKEKIVEVVAIDTNAIDEETYRDFTGLDKSVDYLQDIKEKYITLPHNDRLMGLRETLDSLKPENYDLKSCEFVPDESFPGLYVAKAEVGLKNFAEHALKQTNIYAYAVTPKMRSENQITTFENSTVIESAAPSGFSWLTNFFVHVNRGAVRKVVNRQGTTVGYAKGNSPDQATFGWVIAPRFSIGKGDDKIHVPAQQSLSALVSLPSWWNRAQVLVKTNWIGKRLKPSTNEPEPYDLDLPPNYEQLEADMLQLQQLGPEIMVSMLDKIQLVACEPGAIVLPGRRLWRSTVVTMGHQTADKIFVLPNMKGIIAKFDKVENQMSVREEKQFKKNPRGIEIKRAVRIWTSQGTIALSEPAHIGIQPSCLRPAGQDKR